MLFKARRSFMELSRKTAKVHIINKIETIYQSLSEGNDVSISKRLSLEGQVNLLLDYEMIEFSWLKSTTNEAYQKWIGEPVSPIMWQWMKDDGCFYLPVKMYEAPVYKTTT